MRFRDREDAGRQLAERLADLGLTDPVVLGLPRGGVPVAAQVVARLGGTLEVFVARKVGAPGQEEVGIGAVAEGRDEPVVTDTASRIGVSRAELAVLVERARAELERRVRAYRGDRPLPALTGREVVLVDDGLATGVTAEAALRALRDQQPSRLVLAAPVSAPDTAQRLGRFADDVVCLLTPASFAAVGAWYDDFDQTTDAEVLAALARRPGG